MENNDLIPKKIGGDRINMKQFEYSDLTIDRFLIPHIEEMVHERKNKSRMQFLLMDTLMYHSAIQKEIREILKEGGGENGYSLIRVVNGEEVEVRLESREEMKELISLSKRLYQKANCALKHM